MSRTALLYSAPMEPSTLSQLRAGADALGVQLDEEAALRLSRYWIELRRWGSRINLTASLDEGALLGHSLDSLALLPHVGAEAWIVDVGSGGGFPALVLGCVRPEQRLTL